MILKSIKKINSGKYQIIFDDGTKLMTYDEVILKNNLLYKKELTNEEINEIEKQNNYYNIYDKTNKFIAKKMRSKKEVCSYLSKFELEEKTRNKIIEDLNLCGLLDDKMFIKAYVSDRFHLSNEGPNKIRSDLNKHDLNEQDIEDEICKIDEDEILTKLTRLVNKKSKTFNGSEFNMKNKIYTDLYSLGFSKEMIDNVKIESFDDSKALEKDYQKAYISLAKKEKDESKLFYKIKQKLYQKGYSLDKINEIVTKKRD